MTEATPSKPRGGCFKFALIGLGVFIALVVVGTIFGGGDKAAENTQASNEPPIEVTARELGQAYDANEAAAQLKYGERRLLVSGVIEAIQLDFANKPFLVLRTIETQLGANANLTESSQSRATELSKGQNVSLLCDGVSEVLGMPQLEDCEIQ